LGEVVAFGIEGTGSFGAGLARYLAGRGRSVIEVSRPDRSTRRRLGKSDPVDAEMAARAVLAGVAKDSPKSGLDEVEMIRMLKIVKDSAIKARTQAINQMKALVVTAPVELRHKLVGLNVRRLVARCVRFRPGELVAPLAAAKHALRMLARRHCQLTSEIESIDGEMVRLTAKTAPALVDVFGVGPDVAATLLVTAGSNPERVRSEAAFAALCGVNPIPASSGRTNRHRLNRGGDRRANAALYRIVLVRLRYHEPTKEYMSRRTSEGMTKAEIIRCLKRYVARQVYAILRDMGRQNLKLSAP
jgi:transposase